MTRANPAIAFAVAVLGIAIFSAMDAMMKQLSIEIGAYNAMLWRTIIAFGISGTLFLGSGGRWPSRSVFRLHLWRGIAAAASVLMFFWGIARMPIAQGVALSFIAPLIALYLAAVVLKETVGKGAIAASLLAFAGVIVILIGQSREEMGPEAFRGAVAILVAAVLYAGSLILGRKQSQVASPIEVGFFFNVIAIGMYGMASPWLAVLPSMGQLPRLLLCAIFSLVSIMLLAWAYARAEANYLLPVEYTAFIWAALLGWWAFGEAVSPLTLVGAAMIVAGCLWAARRRPPPMPTTEAAL
ncbi:S-adenosylmethionine uptake transporter [Sphingomonas zeicaulis]|uniref:DMT family transporter n=1 Tax=Sphingomonas zeicaulis TaxID=1632740 RepID=UPI003D257A38